MKHSKKYVVYLLAVLLFSAGWIAPLQAVEPIGQYTLRFEGKKQSDNTEVPLTQVTISNLTQGCDTTITSATFLLKVLPAKTSVGSIETIPSLQARLISENPFMQSTEIEVSLPFSSPLHLTLVGLDGKIQQRYDGSFGSGVHRFSIEPANAGLSFLSISNRIERRVLKLIRMEGGSAAQIRPAGSSEEPAQGSSPETAGQLMFRSATQPFVCYEGDQLQLIGYAEGFANSSIYDSPVKDGDYAFIFEAPFYRIQGHHVETNPPSFVDVLFSVEDFSYKGVDNLSNQDFVIKENGKKVGSEGFPYIRKMNTVPYTIKTVLLLDNSYSLSTEDREKMKAAAISLINSKEDNQEIAVYCFSNETTLLQDFTTDTELLVQAVESIQLGDASTNLYGAYIEGVGRFTNVFTPEEINQGFMVVFSDGDDTANNYSIWDATNARRNKRVYMVGLGEEIDPATLEELANPGPHFSITSADLLERVFLQIQQDIVRYANSFYWLNYLSPTRGGYVQLEVEINQNPNTGSDASYPADFPATNFESAPLGGGVYIDPYLRGNGKEGYAPEYILKNESDQYTLSVVTYWANNLPSYVWSSSDERIARIEVAPRSFNEAELIFPTENNPGGIATITVRDEANTGVDGKIFERTLQVQAMTAPKLTTREVSDITYHTATTGGVITDEGGLSITQRGVRYGTLREELDRQIYNYSGEDEFACELTGLEPGTTYYVQAYALNRKGEGYGEILSFRTPDAVVPTVTTGEVTDITDNSAWCTATVTAENGASVTEQGVCWSTTNNPTTADSKATGSNNIILSDLQPNTTYYVWAYAVNSAGTGYGEVKTFKTDMSLPRLTTQAATDITLTSAKVGGSITDAGVPTYTERGICYATTNNPTIDNNKLPVAGSGTGDFSASMTGLTVGTTYYFRTYAINERGVAYGGVQNFITDMISPIVTTKDAVDITQTSAILGGSITDAGLPAYTERGICYATTSSPTIDNNKQPMAGDGTGDFSANLTGLRSGTTYYVRAYAINKKGTVYGSTISFRTSNSVPTVTTTVSSITHNSASCTVTVAHNGGSSITEQGVCWSTTSNPTTADNKITGSNNITLSSLQPETVYYVRAYAVNSVGTGYSNMVSFRITAPVLINGVRWSPSNVGVANPEDYGNYYTWEEAQTVCPKGWRLPTREELQKLVDAGSTWTTQNGVRGRLFGSGSNTIFLPAAGNSSGSLSDVGSYGHYWSSAQYGSSIAYSLFFTGTYADTYNNNKAIGHCVRCVLAE